MVYKIQKLTRKKIKKFIYDNALASKNTLHTCMTVYCFDDTTVILKERQWLKNLLFSSTAGFFGYTSE